MDDKRGVDLLKQCEASPSRLGAKASWLHHRGVDRVFFLRIDPIVAIVDPDDPFQEEIPS